MKNNIANKLVIRGTGEQINEVINFIKMDKVEDNQNFYGLGAIDFNKIVPMPYNIKRVDINHECDMKITLNFVTAWTSAIELMVDLSKKFNRIIIEYGWSDYEVGDIIGRVVIKAGEIDQERTKKVKVGAEEKYGISEWVFSKI